jgi:hypothetical protein
MKKTVLIGLCLLFASNAFAQTSDSLLPTCLRYEVATDLLWLIDKNNVPRTSLFFRYNFRNRSQALRFRVGMENKRENSQRSVDDSITFIYEPARRRSYAVSVGYEWQKPFKEWLLYSGVDLNFRYADTLSFVPNKRHWVNYEAKYSEHSFIYGTSGFIGCKYFVNSKMAISFESCFSINYRKSYAEFERYKPMSIIGDFFEKTWLFSFKPIQVLQFSYLF